MGVALLRHLRATPGSRGEGPSDGVTAPLPRISAVVLAWLAEPFLPRCVEALLASEKVDVDVILVDNGCTTDDVAVLREAARRHRR